MRWAALTAIVISAFALAAAFPAAASAATFKVNDAGDTDSGIVDGVCDADDNPGNGKQCTLREAIAEANFGPGGRDRIEFAGSLTGATIAPTANFNIQAPVVIDGGDCPDPPLSHGPCVRIDNDGPGVLFSLNEDGDDVTIKGLAMTGTINGFPAVAVRDGANRFKLRNSWLGMDLSQNPDANDIGVTLEGNEAVIGGKRGKDRNVFAYSNGEHLATTGPSFDPGNRNKVRGNYFGTLADGTTPAGSPSTAIRIAGEDNVIGASISSSKRATTKCDGGCNVVANAFTGVFDEGERTKIKGNFIGLDKTGATVLENSEGIDERGEDSTIGGSSRDRNFIAGGSFGVFKFAATNMAVKRNFIGLNSAGTAVPAGAETNTAIVVGSGGLAARNRIAACATCINVDNDGARVVRNKIGLDMNGSNEQGASIAGILVRRADGVIGEPGAGNTVVNGADGIVITPGGGGSDGDGNKVQGNYIGVDSAGVARPNSGTGIALNPNGPVAPDDNLIGGGSSASENVISNSGLDAIRITSSTVPGGGSPMRNQIKRNRGKDNGDGDMDCAGEPCDLFIDLGGPTGSDGFGNPAGFPGSPPPPNDQIVAPELTNDDPGDATRTHLEGTARENATIYIFRTSAPADLSPNRINAFVKMVSVGGGNEWSANFSKIPAGQRLTALQIDPNGNASELALAVDPVAP